MRKLLVLLALALAPLAFAHSTQSTTVVETDNGMRFEIVRDSQAGSFARFTRDGVRYMTRDSAVLAKLDKACARDTSVGREHAALGRRHAELGREQAELGRQLAHARSDEERSSIEARQRKLDEKQRALDDEDRELESKQKTTEHDMNRDLERIWDEAIHDGVANRY